MISFYPGPSRVHDAIPSYVKDAYKSGIMSINHRSDDFMKMSETTIKLLREKLSIPKNYIVLFTTSATECWEIITQSLILDKSYHLYNGAFGQKWYEYTKKLRASAMPLPFEMNVKLDPTKLIFQQHEGVICITQNETSNGTQVHNATIKSIKKNNPSYLIAIDATSSIGGIKLDFKAADIWLGSVQKCFGLPAGLGIMICSPQTVERAKINAERNHYNSLVFMLEMIEKWQTPFTPNVLGIYLLMRVLEASPDIDQVHLKVEKRFKEWNEFLLSRKQIKHLVDEPQVQSLTVLPIKGEERLLEEIKRAARKENILLGEGYGEYKKATFRIANFPALADKEIKQLRNLLKDY